MATRYNDVSLFLFSRTYRYKARTSISESTRADIATAPLLVSNFKPAKYRRRLYALVGTAVLIRAAVANRRGKTQRFLQGGKPRKWKQAFSWARNRWALLKGYAACLPK